MLNKEAILKTDDLKKSVVDVPEWGPGGKVTVRELTSLEHDGYQYSMVKRTADGEVVTDMAEANVTLAVLGTINEDGTNMFTKADLKKLGAKSSRVIGRLADEILKLSGMTADAIDDAEGN